MRRPLIVSSRLAQPVRFGLVGAVNTLLGLSLILLARSLLGLGEIAANALGYAGGLTVSFLLNRRWTFGHRAPVSGAALRFAAVVLGAWGINLVCLLALIASGTPGGWAQAVAVAPYTLSMYLGCRHWAFAPPVRPVGEGRSS